MISALQCVLLLTTYKDVKKDSSFAISFLLPIYTIATGMNFISEWNLSYHAYIIFGIILFILGEVVTRDKENFNISFFVFSHLYLVITYFITTCIHETEMLKNSIYWAILFGIYGYSFYKIKQIAFKYLAYLAVNIVIISIFMLLGAQQYFLYLTILLTMIMIIIIQNRIPQLKDSYDSIFIMIYAILEYIYLIQLPERLSLVMGIIFSVLLFFYNMKSKYNTYFNIVPLIGMLPIIYDSLLPEIVIIMTGLISTVLLTGISLKGRKINLYTVFSGIYLFAMTREIDYAIENSEVLNRLLWIIWAGISTGFMKQNKEKDIFSALTAIGFLRLYYTLIDLMDVQEYTLLQYAGIIFFAIFIIRGVLHKYWESVDVIESITFVILYFSAFLSYNDEIDGMLFICLVISIIIVSYEKGYGTLFLISIADVLINILLLTRAFWFSIPWWVYLLLIGSVLITFAIRNEVNESKDKFKLSDWVKTVKDKVDDKL